MLYIGYLFGWYTLGAVYQLILGASCVSWKSQQRGDSLPVDMFQSEEGWINFKTSNPPKAVEIFASRASSSFGQWAALRRQLLRNVANNFLVIRHVTDICMFCTLLWALWSCKWRNMAASIIESWICRLCNDGKTSRSSFIPLLAFFIVT